MPRPDTELTHSEAGYIYFQGKVYDLHLMAPACWTLHRGKEIVYEGESIEDCEAYLMALTM
ncbi:hypothetical protein [Nitrospira sp. BLG_2]|uniref:hypothetical protein n=1 Tax=Nitrospira sp. BLG_2 TaxID=3397507 RepID=UPI003B9D75FE